MSSERRPLRLVARLKNNRLLAAREALGLTGRAAAAGAGVQPDWLSAYENLRRTPTNSSGEWRPCARRLATFYGAPPEELWPEELGAVRATVSQVEIDVPRWALEAPATPEQLCAEGELLAHAREMLTRLSPREQAILERRLGLDGGEPATLEEAGAAHGVGRERARGIEAQAIRKLQALAKDLDP